MNIEPLRVEESEYNGVKTRIYIYIYRDAIIEISGVEDLSDEEIQGRLEEAFNQLKAAEAPPEG